MVFYFGKQKFLPPLVVGVENDTCGCVGCDAGLLATLFFTFVNTMNSPSLNPNEDSFWSFFKIFPKKIKMNKLYKKTLEK